MGGDDFNKTDDDEDNSNYEIDINVIIEQSIKEHDKNIDQHKSINREWRDSFVEAIWRKIKNKVNNEITRIIKQEFHRRNYAHYNKNIERNVWIDLPTEVFLPHPQLMDRRIKIYYTVKSNQEHMYLEYFSENGLPAGTASYEQYICRCYFRRRTTGPHFVHMSKEKLLDARNIRLT